MTEPIPLVMPAVATEDLPPEVTRIVAKGTGSSSEAAFQDAIDTALHQAVASEVTAADWRQHNQHYFALLRQNGAGLLHGWHEVASASNRRLTHRVYHSEVAVEVDLKTLRERLNSAGRRTKP